MRSSLLLFLFILLLGCSNDDYDESQYGDEILTISVLDWANLGTICPAPKTVNGLARLELIFNGTAPKKGILELQTKWKLPNDDVWMEDTYTSLKTSELSRDNEKLFLKNGFCWGLENSIIKCEIIYKTPSGKISPLYTVMIERPE